jgi:hypothetical protein
VKTWLYVNRSLVLRILPFAIFAACGVVFLLFASMHLAKLSFIFWGVIFLAAFQLRGFLR